MRQNGAMFICNRCRKQVFAERFDDGVFDQKALDGWALEMRNIHGIGDLGPFVKRGPLALSKGKVRDREEEVAPEP